MVVRWLAHLEIFLECHILAVDRFKDITVHSDAESIGGFVAVLAVADVFLAFTVWHDTRWIGRQTNAAQIASPRVKVFEADQLGI